MLAAIAASRKRRDRGGIGAGSGPSPPKAAFEATRGEAKVYVSKGDSGGEARRAFCAECGSPLWSAPAGGPFIPVKLGALDDGSDLTPTLHLYVASAAPGRLMHEGLPTFPKMPPFPPASP